MKMCLLLLAFAGQAYQTEPNPSYSRVVCHPEKPVTVNLNPARGCLVIFDRPFLTTWSSDGGQFFSYTNWENASPPNTMVIIKNTTVTEEDQNLFFLFEGNAVVELVLTLTDKPDEDRIIRIQVQGSLATNLARIPPPPEQDPIREEAAARLVQGNVQRLKTPHGTAFYDFSKAPYFLYFQQKPESPPLTTLEIVKGRRKRLSRRMDYEIPVRPDRSTTVNGHPFHFYPIQALSQREAYYFRLQARGERLPTTKKLGK